MVEIPFIKAALALAKRGLNVDRWFIGISPGGVGQSLYTAHLDAMLGNNHCYFDPNVWFSEDELRKQVSLIKLVRRYRHFGKHVFHYCINLI